MKLESLLCLALVLGGVSCSTPVRHHSHVPLSGISDVDKLQLKVVAMDSEETGAQNGYGANAVDGDPNTYWHTQWQSNSPGLPHEIIIELFPPSVIKGFTCLPRQDVSDHGTIKDYEFYVSDDGTNFGQPVNKGAFEPGKGEQIETFEPVNCRIIKLRALSEITGQPWTSAAEISVIRAGEEAVTNNYWRGNLGSGERGVTPQDSTKPDAIDRLVANLSATSGFYLNGFPTGSNLPQSATPEELVSEAFLKTDFNPGRVTNHRILKIRQIVVNEGNVNFHHYTAVLTDTNLGKKIILLQYVNTNGTLAGYWWRRIYNADSSTDRYY